MKILKHVTLIALICVGLPMVAAKMIRRPESPAQMNDRLALKIAEMLNGSIPTEADLYPLFIADYANAQTQPLGQIVDQRIGYIQNVRQKLNDELPKDSPALITINNFYENTLMKEWRDYLNNLKKLEEERRREGKAIIRWQ
jgi:hypothetical protein